MNFIEKKKHEKKNKGSAVFSSTHEPDSTTRHSFRYSYDSVF